jgi:hypothetical protein
MQFYAWFWIFGALSALIGQASRSDVKGIALAKMMPTHQRIPTSNVDSVDARHPPMPSQFPLRFGHCGNSGGPT